MSTTDNHDRIQRLHPPLFFSMPLIWRTLMINCLIPLCRSVFSSRLYFTLSCSHERCTVQIEHINKEKSLSFVYNCRQANCVANYWQFFVTTCYRNILPCAEVKIAREFNSHKTCWAQIQLKEFLICRQPTPSCSSNIEQSESKNLWWFTIIVSIVSILKWGLLPSACYPIF